MNFTVFFCIIDIGDSMYKAILFDMDGVITNTEHFHYQSWKKAFGELEIDLTEEDYMNKCQSRNREVAIRNIIKGASDETIRAVSNAKTKYYKTFLDGEIEVFKDAQKVIKHLHKLGITMAVVSSSSKALEVINKIGFSSYFSLVVSGTGGLNLRNKPYPDIYQYAIRQLGLKPNDCLVVEDSISGIKAGLAARCHVLGINRNGNLDGYNDIITVNKKISLLDVLGGE